MHFEVPSWCRSTTRFSRIARLVRATRPQTLFLLDQAHIEFVADGYPDGLSLLGRPNFNCVLLRTFSKAYGLAGLRIGYAICSEGNRTGGRKGEAPFNVNAAAQMAAIAALSDQEWMKSAVTRVVAERGRLASRLSALGLRVADSQTNFLFFRTAMPGTTLAESLLKDGIVVKPWREAGYTNWSRVYRGDTGGKRSLPGFGRKHHRRFAHRDEFL
ncbi:aminotransferase class1/class2 domain-containing protein (plasmid) [Rhizobium etli 8C-3]|uniref:Aminotransferase class1/class2 domain-containing protein n=1 Tax=Rhizobium etli 8C-3 TaxID=538025 RepID=A0A1L5PCL7_RHIET|nr:aminotransferase class1/class2 domain-containing protein [Rhizobium etli 8C-3]